MTFEKIILNNTLRNLRIYIGYLLSSIFSVTTFFILSMIYNHPFFKEKYNYGFFLFGREIIYIITIFFIMYFLKMFINSKKKDFGMFLILGMDKNQLRKILFIENMVIGILSITLGISSGIVFLKFFLMIISSILSIEELRFYFSIKVIISTIFRYLALFYIIPIVIGKTIKLKDVIHLINHKKEEVKKINIHPINSIISILIIALGYFCAFTLNRNNILSNRFFIVLTLFILGNFLFFYYIINYIIYLISKIKKIYLNKVNFLFISSLRYRVYNNIHMLFIVTVLLTVSFTSIGTAYIQKSVLKRDSVKNSPFSLNYFVKDYFKYYNDEKFIDDVLQTNNIKYNKIKLNIIKVVKRQSGEDENTYYNLIKESEYNNAASLIKRKPVSLEKKETVLVPNYEDLIDSEKKLIGKKINFYEDEEFIVKSSVEGCVTFKGLLLDTFIISDEKFDSIYNKFNKRMFVGYGFENWEEAKALTEKIHGESEDLNKVRNIDNLFISRMYAYGVERESNSILCYFIFFIGSILYLVSVSFMSYRFYIELREEENKYDNMINLGVTPKELKQVISREMMVIFFAPYVIATINALFVYKIVYIIYSIPIFKSILEIMFIFFIINSLYFFVWRFKNISFIR